MKIHISGQYGDPKAADIFFPFQKRFNELFEIYILGVYLKSIIKLSIVFRVSGKTRNFGSSGPERLKHMKVDSELTIDLVFPEDQWKGNDIESIKMRIKKGVEDCLQLLVEKADDLGELAERELLDDDLKKVFSSF